MIPTLNSPVSPYLVGGIVLAIGALLGAIGARTRIRHSELRRDRLYVTRRRGEELPPEEPPRLAVVLQYAGVAVAFVGIVVLVAAWSTAAGQS